MKVYTSSSRREGERGGEGGGGLVTWLAQYAVLGIVSRPRGHLAHPVSSGVLVVHQQGGGK